MMSILLRRLGLQCRAAHRLPCRAASSQRSSSEPDLTGEQAEIAGKAIHGDRNMFITGSAGTGKTHVLKHVISELVKKHGREAVAVTAATGIAASIINGTTLHSFAGIGIGVKANQTTDEFITSYLRNKKNRWKQIKVLIVDEISMIDSDTLSLIDTLSKKSRQMPAMGFGGIRIILCGDFYQLPPVQLGRPAWPRQEGEDCKTRGKKKFAFDCDTWRSCNIEVLELVEPQRQHDDLEYAKLLRQCRLGKPSAADLSVLQACHIDVKPDSDDGVVPTRLYCKNVDVDSENLDMLGKLPGKRWVIKAEDKWNILDPQTRNADWFDRDITPINAPRDTHAKAVIAAMDSSVPSKLTLKIGAQVDCSITANTMSLV